MATLRKSISSRARSRPRRARVEGKITKSGVTRRRIEERARELALIRGRSPNRVTTSDLRQAKRELVGAVHPTSRAKDETKLTAPEWGSPQTSSGRRTRVLRPRDGQSTKELVEEGMDEAEHDQMLAARKARK